MLDPRVGCAVAGTSRAALPTYPAGSIVYTDRSNFIEAYLDQPAGTGKNVGENKTLKPSGSVNDTNSGNNYDVTFVSADTGVIKQLHITGTFTAANKPYDGNTTATVLMRSLPTAISGDDVALTGGTAAFADANVGNGKTVTLAGATLGGADAGNYVLDSVATTTANITKAGTTTVITSDLPDPSAVGQGVTVNFTVTPAKGGTPIGLVTVTDGAGASTLRPGAATANTTGACSLTPTVVGDKTLTATYAGDSNFLGSSGTTLHQVYAYTFNGFLSPVVTDSQFAGDRNRGSNLPIKYQLKDPSGNLISDLASLVSLVAVFNTGPASGACAIVPIGTLGSTSTTLYANSTPSNGNTFGYTDNQFLFGWKTTDVNLGCYTLWFMFRDTSSRKFSIRLN